MVGREKNPRPSPRSRKSVAAKPQEVIRDGLRLMKERDELHQSKLAELRRAIAIGIDQADRDEV